MVFHTQVQRPVHLVSGGFIELWDSTTDFLLWIHYNLFSWFLTSSSGSPHLLDPFPFSIVPKSISDKNVEFQLEDEIPLDKLLSVKATSKTTE